MNIVAEKLCTQRNFLSQSAETDNQVERVSAHHARWQSVDRARAFQTNSPFGKPIWRIPIFWREMFAQAEAKTGQIKIAAILRFEPNIIDAQERNRFGSRR